MKKAYENIKYLKNIAILGQHAYNEDRKIESMLKNM